MPKPVFPRLVLALTASVLLRTSHAQSSSYGLYDLYFRVDSIALGPNVQILDNIPALFIQYYDTGCHALSGSASSVTNKNSTSSSWPNDPLYYIGNVFSSSDIKCVKFVVYDASEISGTQDTVQTFSFSSTIYSQYLQHSVDTTAHWTYTDPATQTYVTYSTRVQYAQGLTNLAAQAQANRAAALWVIFTTLFVSIGIALWEFRSQGPRGRTPLEIAVSVAKTTMWLFIGGLYTAVLYAVITAILLVSVVGIPFGLKLWRLAIVVLLPFEHEVVDDESNAHERLTFSANVVWIVIGGAWLSIMHLACAIVLICTIVGIPFALQQIKLAKVALFPFGKSVVKTLVGDMGPPKNGFSFDPDKLKEEAKEQEQGSMQELPPEITRAGSGAPTAF